MNDTEKTIKALESQLEFHKIQGTSHCYNAFVLADALKLLKQYSGLTKALEQSNAVNEHLNAEIERLEKENGTLKLAVQSMPNWLDEKRPEVVRCKDCKHRPKVEYGMAEFPDAKCPCQNPDDDWYSYNPDDDWYCANGERKDGDGDAE